MVDGARTARNCFAIMYSKDNSPTQSLYRQRSLVASAPPSRAVGWVGRQRGELMGIGPEWRVDGDAPVRDRPRLSALA